jgi:hypothetical protein
LNQDPFLTISVSDGEYNNTNDLFEYYREHLFKQINAQSRKRGIKSKINIGDLSGVD